ncbi:MAG: hypothetical protein A4E27_00259 [Methanobacterium sp. PtaU1.Bin242]|nr:MAG: hypothetical protein A4E27_00259 [Methanobacterium sp. PtaU1.Bin242]
MAALEVVKTRLDRIGLGEFCLEIHSHKSKKKEILKELETTITNTRELEIESEEEFNKMEQLKEELNRYIDLLHTPYGKIKYTPYYLFGLKERSLLHFNSRRLPRFKVKDPEKVTIKDWNIIHSQLRDISELLTLIQPINSNPWRNCKPDQIYPTDQEDIEQLTRTSTDLLDELNNRISYLVKITGVKPPETLDDLNKSISSAEVVAKSLPVEKEVILGDSWDIEQVEGYKFIRDLESLNRYDKKVFTRLDKRILDEDIRVLLEEYKSHSSRLFKFLSRDFKKLKNNISSYYKENLPSNEIVISDLEEAYKYQKIRDEIRKNDTSGRNLFGHYWGSLENTQSLIDFSQWIIPFKDGLSKDLITPESIEIVSLGVNSQEIEDNISEINRIGVEFKKTIEDLDGYLHFNKQIFLARSLEDLHFQLDVFKTEIHSLHKWSQFIQGLNDLSKTRAEGMVDLIYSDILNPDDVSPCFEANFADSLLETVFYTYPEISGFIGKLHEKKIEDFRLLDNNLIELNRHRIIKEVYDRRPPLNISASPNSQLGILKSEFARKRGHMAPRKLFKETGGLIQKIKPCFMMSPLSVAQYLDPAGMGDLRFDYVIFDEASQVKPEDALGSFLRAKKAVIMGDTKQLPPTSFFDAQSDIDDDADNQLNSIKDMESILQLAKSRGFPSKMLKWHYRSRHESLIAVSNQEFYSNELLVYPSPCHDSKDLGLKFVHLPDTVYDRGRSGKNLKEAGCVVQAAFQHYQKYGKGKSLGVGTFNVRQQQAILEELELQLRLHPEMEEFFTSSQDEHFFVKNLETIQGDERDVIMVSIGFGFDQNHNLSHNFGPLNYDGGERRLNVLVTRAREQCIIYANFKARDIELKPSSSFGLKALKVFMEYAETKNLESIGGPGEDTESPFEESVYRFLKSNNYNVHKQVGCAGYRIDLAIVDPEHTGRYLIGVECDGAMYHSSPVARDRDRLRQQVLEGLGWNFHRIWSTDWYRNRGESQRKLLEAIENAGKTPKSDRIVSDHLKVEKLVKEIEPVKDKIKSSNKPMDKSVESEVTDYKICSSIDVDSTVELPQKSMGEISKAIVQIVEVEGPIHNEELIKRIKTLWGIKRAGKKIKDILSSAREMAEMDGDLLIKDEFLYPVNQKIIVRRRSKGQPTNIKLICDEEIAEAIKMVIRQQFATPPDELKKQVANLFGIKVVRAATGDRINSMIKELIKNGNLEETANGMINLTSK